MFATLARWLRPAAVAVSTQSGAHGTFARLPQEQNSYQNLQAQPGSLIVNGEPVELPAFGKRKVMKDFEVEALLTPRPMYAVYGKGHRRPLYILREGDEGQVHVGQNLHLKLELPRVVEWCGIPRFITSVLAAKEFQKWEAQLTSANINMEIIKDRDRLFELGEELEIIASGVSASKGGMRDLLGIAILNKVMSARGDAEGYWGRLKIGPSEYCSGPHGPYYVLKGQDASLSFVLPDRQSVRYFSSALKELVDAAVIDIDLRDSIESRTYTYAEFAKRLKAPAL